MILTVFNFNDIKIANKKQVIINMHKREDYYL